MNSRLMALKDAKGQQATHLVEDVSSRVHTPHEAIAIKANMATSNGAGTEISKSKSIDSDGSKFIFSWLQVFGLWSEAFWINSKHL